MFTTSKWFHSAKILRHSYQHSQSLCGTLLDDQTDCQQVGTHCWLVARHQWSGRGGLTDSDRRLRDAAREGNKKPFLQGGFPAQGPIANPTNDELCDAFLFIMNRMYQCEHSCCEVHRSATGEYKCGCIEFIKTVQCLATVLVSHIGHRSVLEEKARMLPYKKQQNRMKMIYGDALLNVKQHHLEET
jgi:hypothetical protein